MAVFLPGRHVPERPRASRPQLVRQRFLQRFVPAPERHRRRIRRVGDGPPGDLLPTLVSRTVDTGCPTPDGRQPFATSVSPTTAASLSARCLTTWGHSRLRRLSGPGRYRPNPSNFPQTVRLSSYPRHGSPDTEPSNEAGIPSGVSTAPSVSPRCHPRWLTVGELMQMVAVV